MLVRRFRSASVLDLKYARDYVAALLLSLFLSSVLSYADAVSKEQKRQLYLPLGLLFLTDRITLLSLLYPYRTRDY